MIPNEALIKQIEIAFENNAYPGDDCIVESSYGEEPEAIKKLFAGKDNWQALDNQFLNQAAASEALSFFSGPAFRFFLPAYLRADVDGKLDLASPEVNLCWSLTPQSEHQKLAQVWGGETIGQRARERFAIFNLPQVSAIVSYLWWKLEYRGDDLCISNALENYWLDREAELESGINLERNR